MCALLYTTLFSTLLYVGLTLCDPILGCGHTLSLRRCGDCLICVFLILYLYNVVSGDCDPHFVFTPRILRVTWVSEYLLTLPLLDITSTRLYHYSTLPLLDSTITRHYTFYPPYRYFRHNGHLSTINWIYKKKFPKKSAGYTQGLVLKWGNFLVVGQLGHTL